MKALARSMAAMAVMSGVSFLTNLGLTHTLHQVAGFSAEVAFLLSLLTVMVMNFLAYRYFIFDTREGDIRGQALRYFLSTLLFRGLEYLAFLVVHTFLGVPYLIAVAGVLATSFLGKFVFFGRVVFRSPLFGGPGAPVGR